MPHPPPQKGIRLGTSVGAASLLLIAGCTHGSFSAQGRLASTGGRLGTWSRAPVSCTRASFLGPAEGEPLRSILTLAWEDPTHYDNYRDVNMEKAGDAPMHLALSARTSPDPGAPAAEDLTASLDTLKHSMGLRMDRSQCRVLRLERSERASPVAAGRSVLDGRLTLDCTADGNHVTGDISFRNCGF